VAAVAGVGRPCPQHHACETGASAVVPQQGQERSSRASTGLLQGAFLCAAVRRPGPWAYSQWYVLQTGDDAANRARAGRAACSPRAGGLPWRPTGMLVKAGAFWDGQRRRRAGRGAQLQSVYVHDVGSSGQGHQRQFAAFLTRGAPHSHGPRRFDWDGRGPRAHSRERRRLAQPTQASSAIQPGGLVVRRARLTARGAAAALPHRGRVGEGGARREQGRPVGHGGGDALRVFGRLQLPAPGDGAAGGRPDPSGVAEDLSAIAGVEGQPPARVTYRTGDGRRAWTATGRFRRARRRPRRSPTALHVATPSSDRRGARPGPPLGDSAARTSREDLGGVLREAVRRLHSVWIRMMMDSPTPPPPSRTHAVSRAEPAAGGDGKARHPIHGQPLFRYTYADFASDPAAPGRTPCKRSAARRRSLATLAWNSHRHLSYWAVPLMGACCHTTKLPVAPRDLAYTRRSRGESVSLLRASTVAGAGVPPQGLRRSARS